MMIFTDLSLAVGRSPGAEGHYMRVARGMQAPAGGVACFMGKRGGRGESK